MSGFIFRPEDHTYWLDGKQIPGVTSTLQVLGAYDGIPASILEAASERGTAVHLCTELYDQGQLDFSTVHDDLLPYLTAWMNFLDDKKPEIVAVEQRTYHKVLRYAGTMDRELVMCGVRGVLDLKATWMMNPATGPQTAAYLEALNSHREKKDHLKGRWGLQLKRDGTYELHTYKDAGDWQDFLACLRVRHWKDRNIKPSQMKEATK